MFYHLGELDDALNYALDAGSKFDVNEQSEFVQTLVGEQSVANVCTVWVDWGIAGGLRWCGAEPCFVMLPAARCLDRYFELRTKQVEQKEEVTINSRLVAIVERMLDKSVGEPAVPRPCHACCALTDTSGACWSLQQPAHQPQRTEHGHLGLGVGKAWPGKPVSGPPGLTCAAP